VAIRPILTADKPVLRQKARPVQRIDGSVRALLRDMVETMRAAPGVGLAGPQIGERLRLIVVEHEDDLFTLANPELIWTSHERDTDLEGCLSIPGYHGYVNRPSKVRVRARDERGKQVQVAAEGRLARIFQHEIDHLDGILFIDRMAPGERLYTEEELTEPEAAAAANG
jgi:peptide deformylase